MDSNLRHRFAHNYETVDQNSSSSDSDTSQQPSEESCNLSSCESEPCGLIDWHDVINEIQHIVLLFLPVSSTIALTCFLLRVCKHNELQYKRELTIFLPYTPFHSGTEDVTWKLAETVGNTITFLSIIILMTIFVLYMYKNRNYKFLILWLYGTIGMLLMMFIFVVIQELCLYYNFAISMPTFGLIGWNFVTVGFCAIFYHSPIQVRQFFIVTNASAMAVMMTRLMPDWTVWSILVLVTAWDIFAILTPNGPLRQLIELVYERNEGIENIAALVYKTQASEPEYRQETEFQRQEKIQEYEEDGNLALSDSGDSTGVLVEEIEQPVEHIVCGHPIGSTSECDGSLNSGSPNTKFDIQDFIKVDTSDAGVKLGVGDFIFYSILVGHASMKGDVFATVSCYVGVMMGLIMTLGSLPKFRATLPALPISISLGLILYFCCRTLAFPLIQLCGSRQIFF